MDSKWGCSSDSLRYHRKHNATGVLLHLGISVGSLSFLSISLLFFVFRFTLPFGAFSFLFQGL